MTSDAKIGLLLGLVFIFIIAFIINGLPNFNKEAKNNELTTKMVGLQNDAAGLGTHERKLTRELINPVQPRAEDIQPVTQTAVPVAGSQEPVAATETVNVAPILQPDTTAVVAQQVMESAAAEAPATQIITAPAASAEPVKAEEKQEITKSVYVVREGESLASIARKVYGVSLGNKKATVEGLFKANKGVLKSPDAICVGQRLTVPKVPAAGQNQAEGILAGAMFDKVESIGPKKVESVGPKHVAESAAKPKLRTYVVKEGDSLWRIAGEQLGNGNRYPEITALNKDILNGRDNLVVGMRLKLPAK